MTHPGETTHRAVLDALALGYRHVDTARIYDNGEDVGRALRASGVAREEIFVTTKLWNSDHGYDRTLRAPRARIRRSLPRALAGRAAAQGHLARHGEAP